MNLNSNIRISTKNKVPRSRLIDSGFNNLLHSIPRKLKISGHFGLNNPLFYKIHKDLSLDN